MTGKNLTADQRDTAREQAARLYLAGSGIHAVAHTTGRSYGLTRRLLIEAGVQLRKRGRQRVMGSKAAD